MSHSRSNIEAIVAAAVVAAFDAGHAMLRTAVIGALTILALALSSAAPAQDSWPSATPSGVKTAADYPVWKTIMLGTHRNAMAMRDALDAEPARVGDSADEILSRPAFRFVTIKTDVDLG